MKIQDRKEEKLFDELEAMYQRVAESERSEADNERVEALQSYYESLQVSPDASLETIKKAYERLVDFWDPGQFADNPSLREKAERKLTEITHAYGKILAFRQMESGLPSAVPPIQITEEADLSGPAKEKGHHFTRGRILLGGAAFVVGVLAGGLWPTVYHYDTASYGNKTYQVRTNRITHSMTYFAEGKWNNLPIPAAKPSQTPLPVPDPPAPPPELVGQQPIPTPATKPGSAEGQKVAGKKEAPSEKQPSQPTKTEGYAIQLSAMRDRNLAREFVETQRRSGQEVHLAEMKIRDRGVWYVVYIGRFADRGEAARYMKEKKIKEIFPECFIQKLSQ